MQAARIVQITDLHILADEEATISGVNTSQSLALVINDIQSLTPPPQLVIASGDLTDDGSAAAYRKLKSLFGKLDYPVYILAGNHDEIAVMQSELVGDNVFYQRQISLDDWQILLVNSKARDGSFGFTSKAELCWLNDELDKAKQPVLLAMHHTPLRLCASQTCQFKNAGELLSVINKHQVARGLIAGHTHNDVEEVRDNLRIMTTPSTMVQVTHNQHEARTPDKDFWAFHVPDIFRHGYRVVDLYANGEIVSEVHWVEASQG